MIVVNLSPCNVCEYVKVIQDKIVYIMLLFIVESRLINIQMYI